MQTGLATQIQADHQGDFPLPEIGMRIGVDKQSIYFIDDETGEMLLDAETERMERRAAEERAESAEAENR